MIYDIRLENDEGHFTLVLDDAFGTHLYQVDPQMLHDAMARWREHMAEGERVRLERVAAGAPSWDEYAACMDDDDEALRAQGDWLRKQAKEK